MLMRLLPVALFLELAATATSLTPITTTRDAEIRRRLKEFEDNPAHAMAEHLLKRDIHGRLAISPQHPRFKLSDVRSGQYVTQKDILRRRLKLIRDNVRLKLEQVRPGRAAFERDDRAEDLVDMPPEQMLKSLEKIEAAGLTEAHLPETPWSDSYWPVYQGQIAARYADTRFNAASEDDWTKFHSYVSAPQRSFRKLFSNLLEGEPVAYPIDNLSPAEKYDLLVGDSDALLTKTNWQEGKNDRDDSGQVETWMGLCHGWAPASFMEPRPQHAVTVLAADGATKLTFYPSDIKALATELWANADTPARYVGGRCDDKNPARDANGRIISQACFDTNPGTWHLSVVNQIGKAHRGFVIDATFDYEVWNQPVTGYKYTYFNPQTGETVRKLEDARVTLADYHKDKFRKYRSKEARSLVGVAMDVTYVEETDPSHAKIDTPDNDQLRTVTYLYDLELNNEGEIIGGEWRSNESPDFMWAVPPGTRARSEADSLTQGNWNLSQALPSSWQEAARESSPYALPLGRVVHELIKASRTDEN